jgi:hypothetical protein
MFLVSPPQGDLRDVLGTNARTGNFQLARHPFGEAT